MNYSQLAFSDAAKELQQEFGSRQLYERVEKYHVQDGLTENEIKFIGAQDHFYMATIGENGYPYIQHRGGPKGFVKVLDVHTLAFVDFSGNRQYISVGNIETNPNVALIMVAYPHRARLKIYAQAKVVQITDAPELFAQIDPADYKHRPERMLVLTVQAYDWNCPQHITPRYTAEELEPTFAAQRQRLSDLEAENQKLKAELENLKIAPK
ncbi:pyridoxamine 5'-phosphate oxidase family protein [Adhaeribacter swui]|uniref:Pyridoxamine 5'-phosphate oxidase family protein n=1 Tax=Adhaeribacter swui TaxID=2086471 RepID=A0A7G7G4W3_9BACT|nr:pyridoxamine 5'-phosphate oxidase family protein [Adhaeribacter swui]QNF32197.1 pyridoxamine 5'-phosphate oxidase family protein [Adhaeribacter swui]